MTKQGASAGADMRAEVAAEVAKVMRADHGRLLSTLGFRLGDLQLAEDCLQAAYERALVHWGRLGLPVSPAGWLLRVAQRRAIDRFRKEARFAARAREIALLAEEDAEMGETTDIPDERLRLMFTCCHPALERKSRVALTLVSLGGLTTEEVARAFLDKPATMGQRLTRARRKIRDAGIAYEVPEGEALIARRAAVLEVIYLIFNEGYAVTSGPGQLRVDLCEEAIFLGRMLCALCPKTPEVMGLLGVMLLIHARWDARTDEAGRYVPMTQQDRGRWDQAMIGEGAALIEQAMSMGQIGPYQVQGAIAALHCEAPRAKDTDWQQIAALYRVLCAMEPGPVVQLNYAVARAEIDGPEAGLALLAPLADALDGYQPFHAARAHFLRDTGALAASVASFDRALRLTKVATEARYLEGQRAQVLAAQT
ncbi:MAG: RNA polymerase sigma factor [Maritimibacter sp.]